MRLPAACSIYPLEIQCKKRGETGDSRAAYCPLLLELLLSSRLLQLINASAVHANTIDKLLELVKNKPDLHPRYWKRNDTSEQHSMESSIKAF